MQQTQLYLNGPLSAAPKSTYNDVASFGSMQESMTSHELFSKSLINLKTRGHALTKIYQSYKTIVVTDAETKTSKVISFKALYADP